MRFDIKEIDDGGLTVDIPITEAWLTEECPGVEAKLGPKGLRLRGSLQKTGEDVLLRAHLTGEMRSVCVRCLEEARIRVSFPMLTTFVEPDDDDDEDENDDVDVAHFDGDKVDLGPEIRDHLMLTLPLHPLCREDCLGLCAVCGGNRNVDPCSCEAKARQAASPLAGLGKIKLSD